MGQFQKSQRIYSEKNLPLTQTHIPKPRSLERIPLGLLDVYIEINMRRLGSNCISH